MNVEEQHAFRSKVTQFIWLVFGVVEGLIGLRVLLRLLGANPQNPFAEAVYALTRPFVLPFVSLTAQPRIDDLVLEISSIVAMLVYALVAWVVVEAIAIVLDPLRRRSSSGGDRETG
jgi:uncharacterized protein YggT (Ycf19 family)